jgi:hypothetical protein
MTCPPLHSARLSVSCCWVEYPSGQGTQSLSVSSAVPPGEYQPTSQGLAMLLAGSTPLEGHHMHSTAHEQQCHMHSTAHEQQCHMHSTAHEQQCHMRSTAHEQQCHMRSTAHEQQCHMRSTAHEQQCHRAITLPRNTLPHQQAQRWQQMMGS